MESTIKEYIWENRMKVRWGPKWCNTVWQFPSFVVLTVLYENFICLPELKSTFFRLSKIKNKSICFSQAQFFYFDPQKAWGLKNNIFGPNQFCHFDICWIKKKQDRQRSQNYIYEFPHQPRQGSCQGWGSFISNPNSLQFRIKFPYFQGGHVSRSHGCIFLWKKFPLHILKIIFPHKLGMFFKGFIC